MPDDDLHPEHCDCEWCWLGVTYRQPSPQIKAIHERLAERIRAIFAGGPKIKARIRRDAG
jgi:hypothetical protein